MTGNSTSDAAKAVVRRNTEEVQGGGNFDVFEQLFADDFLDHTTQPGTTPDKAGARKLLSREERSIISVAAVPAPTKLRTMEEIERDYIGEVLRRTQGAIAGKGGAAEILGLPPSTLRDRMKRLGIK